MITLPPRRALAITLPLVLVLTAVFAVATPAQQSPKPDSVDKSTASTAPPAAVDATSEIISTSIAHLLKIQEGDDSAEWPYEGVYRVAGEIPIGYRIGGTAIGAIALLHAPGFADDQPRQNAVARAASFIIKNADHPLMNPDYDGGYDVRGWGYAYGLLFLLHYKSSNAAPADLAQPIDGVIKFFIDAIQRTEIPQIGGWNYARSKGRDAVSRPAPFMTAPTLQSLFMARGMGYQVDEAVVTRALNTLDQARTSSGSIQYSGVTGEKSREPVPGAVGRMLVTETTLYLAGRSSIAAIRGAIDAFIVHWQWLDQRRAKTGTHMGPYNIAPYYFYFAHYYAAQAIEMLPQQERPEYRHRLRELLMSVRLPDGTWNDRVFERSSNFGTAMSLMALTMPDQPAPARWQAE